MATRLRRKTSANQVKKFSAARQKKPADENIDAGKGAMPTEGGIG